MKPFLLRDALEAVNGSFAGDPGDLDRRRQDVPELRLGQDGDQIRTARDRRIGARCRRITRKERERSED